jgi:hypothetical protein
MRNYSLLFPFFAALFISLNFYSPLLAESFSQEILEKFINEMQDLRKSNAALASEVAELKADQKRLRQELAGRPSLAASAESSPAAVSELSDLEKELEGAISGTAPKGENVKTTAQSSLNMGGKTNPDMGAVGIISYTGAKRNQEKGGSPNANTFQFDEAELIISGYVDPFHKYDLVLGFHEDEVGVEEAYLSKFDLPMKLAGRMGKWRSGIGFINQHHVDELPWAGEHVFLDSFLGEEGLTTTGFELKKTLKSSGIWTPTVSVEVGSGRDHDATDPTSPTNRLAPWQTRTYAQNRRTIGRLRNHFNIGEKKDLAVGFSYLTADHGELDVLGADFQFRTRPKSYEGWTVLGEYLKRCDDAFTLTRSQAGLGEKNPEGYMLNCDYQWDPLWKAGLIWSEFDSPNRLTSGLSRSKIGYLAYLKTEFTRYLVQLEEREMAGFPKDQRATLQLIFSTGYHRHKLK